MMALIAMMKSRGSAISLREVAEELPAASGRVKELLEGSVGLQVEASTNCPAARGAPSLLTAG